MGSLLQRIADTHPLIRMEAATPTQALVEIAAGLGRFPPARNTAYPGVRRFIGPGDKKAASYAVGLLRQLAPMINTAFDADGFDLLNASFSMVTARPDALEPIQRAPHFDSVDPQYLAILHYISGTEGSGTGFYRQRSTQIERVTTSNRAAFIDASRREAAAWSGYIDQSNSSFEQIGMVEGVPGWVVVYQGSLLHSGIISPGMNYSDDPRHGRLTANFFVRARPRRVAAV